MATSRMTEQIGRVLGGRYRLLAPIGRGASAQVYVADDVRLRRHVAIKILHDALADDQVFLRRFRAEAQAAAALNHPHVMAVYDWGQDDDDVPWIVTEYLGGGSLRAILDRGHRLTPSQALVVGLQAARGLDYAHRRGFVHRDIKPANLLFDDDGRLRIADFGLARALAEAAWTEPQGAVVGTARYASPEQAQGMALSGRADVYSLALVVVEAVTGAVPFATDTTLGTLMARVGTSLVPDAALGPLGGPLAAAGAADPEDRIESRALAAALARVAAELPRPNPLPLAGALDVDLGDERDPTTLVGPSAGDDDLDVPAFVSAAPAPTIDEDDELDEEDEDDATAFDPTWAATPAGAGVASVWARPVEDAEPSGEHDDGDDGDLGDLDWDPRSPTGRRRRRWPVAVLVVVLLAGLGVAVGLLVADLAEGTPTHQVPPVSGLTEKAARASLTQLGYRVEVERIRRDGTTAGDVLGTRPATGVEREEGTVVTLVVSQGPTLVDLPELTPGMAVTEAVNLLRFSGLRADVTERHDEEVPAGQVIAITGTPPDRIEKGTAVALLASLGPEPRTIPGDLAELSQDDAVAALDELGLVAVVDGRYSDDVPEGQVLATEPPAGTEVPRDSEVVVLVSLGPDLVTVPDVSTVGTLADAVDLLEAAGLVSGDVQGPAAGSPAGTSPAAGERIRRGSEVDIILR